MQADPLDMSGVSGDARGMTPLDSFLDHPTPLAIAHRGGAGEGDENTMPAFEHAVRLGYRYVEADVQVSRDGEAVLFHDATLARLTGAQGRVRDQDWPTLAQLRTPRGARLLRLDALLHAFPELRIVLEPKTEAAVPAIARHIRRHNALARVCVGAFRPWRTWRLRREFGEGLCWSPSHFGVARLWVAGLGLPTGQPGFRVVQVPRRWRGVPLVTRGFVRAAHARGIHVHVWTVDDPGEMRDLLDLGVDGLMTDRPTELRAVLEARGDWTGG